MRQKGVWKRFSKIVQDFNVLHDSPPEVGNAAIVSVAKDSWCVSVSLDFFPICLKSKIVSTYVKLML